MWPFSKRTRYQGDIVIKPVPFALHDDPCHSCTGCGKPTVQRHGICDDCIAVDSLTVEAPESGRLTNVWEHTPLGVEVTDSGERIYTGPPELVPVAKPEWVARLENDPRITVTSQYSKGHIAFEVKQL